MPAPDPVGLYSMVGLVAALGVVVGDDLGDRVGLGGRALGGQLAGGAGQAGGVARRAPAPLPAARWRCRVGAAGGEAKGGESGERSELARSRAGEAVHRPRRIVLFAMCVLHRTGSFPRVNPVALCAPGLGSEGHAARPFR